MILNEIHNLIQESLADHIIDASTGAYKYTTQKIAEMRKNREEKKKKQKFRKNMILGGLGLTGLAYYNRDMLPTSEPETDHKLLIGAGLGAGLGIGGYKAYSLNKKKDVQT